MNGAEVFWSEEDDCYVAALLGQPHVNAFGDTREEALEELAIAQSMVAELTYDAESGLWTSL